MAQQQQKETTAHARFKIHKAENRGHNKFDWLDARHTFSFGRFVDRDRMGFRSLRVINNDIVAPGGGFAPHDHDNMEIVTYILEGALAHKDSLGNGSTIRPGQIQRMSAGTGITHSEYNASDKAPVHLYQIWIIPEQKNIPPGYEEKTIDAQTARGKFLLVGDRHGTDGAVTIHQDARMLVAYLSAGDKTDYALSAGRGAFLQVARGDVVVNGHALSTADGIEIENTDNITVTAQTDAELMLFDLK